MSASKARLHVATNLEDSPLQSSMPSPIHSLRRGVGRAFLGTPEDTVDDRVPRVKILVFPRLPARDWPGRELRR